MRLAIFDDWRLGLVDPSSPSLVDVSSAVPNHDSDPFGAGWWVRLCRDFDRLRRDLEAALTGPSLPLAGVTLRAPVLNPGKIIAAAANYGAHIGEMQAVVERTGGDPHSSGSSDFFVKATSSLSGPGEAVIRPGGIPDTAELHHEVELAVVIGRRARAVPVQHALDHVFGYTLALDMTVRGPGERSRRKSYDTFTPCGPWIVTADEVPDPQALRLVLDVGSTRRQDCRTADMIRPVAELVATISAAMTLEPGDLVLTGAPAGVGPVAPGDVMVAGIEGIGRIEVPVIAGTDRRKALI